MARGRDRERYVEEIEEEIRRLKEAYPDEAQDEKKKITPAFVLDCLRKGQYGDGELFAAIFRDRFVFNEISQEWYSWNGVFWERDMTMRAENAVNEVVEAYSREYVRCHKEIAELRKEGGQDARIKALDNIAKKLDERVKALNTSFRRKKCLEFARIVNNPLSVRSDVFDRADDDKDGIMYLAAFKNAVIDLRTGREVEPRPDQYITKAINIEWKGKDAPRKLWLQALREMFGEKEDTPEKESVVAFLQRVFGYGITGSTREDVFIIFHGSGRNGKGVIKDIIMDIFYPMAGPIQSELLLASRNGRSSSGPSPDVMRLKGLRLAFASETDEGKRFSTAQVKLLTGSDKLTARNLHEKDYTDFNPSHLLILLTNDMPKVPYAETAFWARTHVVKFPYSFVERESKEMLAANERLKDKHLREKLRDEYPGIAAWVIEGTRKWLQADGLLPPPRVRKNTEEMRKAEDVIQKFIDARLKPDPHGRILYKDLYDAYVEWYTSNEGDKVLTKSRFSRLLLKYPNFSKEKTGGQIYYCGYSFKSMREQTEAELDLEML